MRKVNVLKKVRMIRQEKQDRIVLNQEEFVTFKTYCRDHQISSSDFLDVMRFFGIQVVRPLVTRRVKGMAR